MRQEYWRVLQEVECGSTSTLACREIQWPSANALCFPRHVDAVGSVTERSVGLPVNHLAAEGEPVVIERLTEREGEDGGGMTSVKIPRQADDARDSAVHETSACTGTENGAEVDAARMDHSVPSPPLLHSELHSTATESSSAKAALWPTRHSDKDYPDTGVQSSPSCSPDGAPDASVLAWLDSARTDGSELPRDREQLLELRTQLAMELLWTRQAIASRQKVRNHFFSDRIQLYTFLHAVSQTQTEDVLE